MTPGEPLHAIELGLMKYAIRGFSIALGLNPDSDGSGLLLSYFVLLNDMPGKLDVVFLIRAIVLFPAHTFQQV